MNGFLEVIKTNKKAIIKKALIVGGTAAGLALVMKAVKANKENDEEGQAILDAFSNPEGSDSEE